MSEQDWLALDKQLRERLQQITLLSGGDHAKGITLNMLTLPFLKTLAKKQGISTVTMTGIKNYTR